MLVKNAEASIENEKELQLTLDEIEFNRLRAIDGLTDRENKFKTLRIRNEEEVADAAMKAEEERQATLIKLEEERQAAIRKSIALERERSAHAVDVAEFALKTAAGELDFEAKRQKLISAITAEYQDQLKVIESLTISEAEKAIRRQEAELRYQQTLYSTNNISNRFAEERIKREEEVADASPDRAKCCDPHAHKNWGYRNCRDFQTAIRTQRTRLQF